MSSFLRTISSMLLGDAFKKAIYVDPKAQMENVQIQPSEALDIANPHLEKQGTHVWRNPDKLETVIIKKGDFYYIKRSDFPAKTADWYLHGAVKVSVEDGSLDFTDPAR